MKLWTTALIIAIGVVLSLAACADNTTIPSCTVIPVVLDNGLNSSINRPGDRFMSHCADATCGCFPVGTTFVGIVNQVICRKGKTPGQIGVYFVEAVLPDCTRVTIEGSLTSLDPTAVSTDSVNGRMTIKADRFECRDRFIGYGLPGGLVIGTLSGDQVTGLLASGGSCCWLACARIKEDMAPDADVPPGTKFGIVLRCDVILCAPAAVEPSGAGPSLQQEPCPPSPSPMQLVFTSHMPYMTSGGVLMVPFRAVANAVGIPFRYDDRLRNITIKTLAGKATQAADTNWVTVCERTITLSAPSRIIAGTFYVPSDFIGVVLNRKVTWMPDTGTLRIQ